MEQSQKSPGSRGILVIFLSFLAAFGILFFVLPDRRFSETENRYLAEVPEFRLSTFIAGKWTSDFETYAADQFPMRDGWVGLKALNEYVLGKRENNGVYLGKGNTLLQDYQGGRYLLENAAAVERFYKAAGIPVYFGLIPDAVWTNRAALPPYSLERSQEADLRSVAENLSFSMLPIARALTERAGEGKLYYDTDHHWTSRGAFIAYQAIMETIGEIPLAEANFDRNVLSDQFLGTLHARSGAWWTGPDTIEGWVPPNIGPVHAEIYEGEALELTLNGFFSPSRLETRDQYAVFLDGNHSRVVVKTMNPNGKKLLLIKDSFAHALVPFLSAHYTEIHMVDLRYYRVNYAAYCEQEGIDEVLILYSLSNFATDSNLVFLNQS